MMTVMAISFLAGLATVAGVMLTLVLGRSGRGLLAGILGLAAGIMSGVVVLELFPSAWTMGGWLPLILGGGAGWFFVRLLSHQLGRGPRGPRERNTGFPGDLVQLGYLVAAGIALHDLPEGIAIAAGYAATPELGWLIALAIGLHNIPEGMAMAAPMLLGGQSPGPIMLTAGLVSLVTPLGALLGFFFVGISPGSIAYLLALAGGSMSYIVIRELWPEGYFQSPRWATLGAILGCLIVGLLLYLE